MSRKPASSISRRMIPTICARSADVALQLVAAQVEPAVAEAQRLVDVLLVELERQRRRARDDLELVDLRARPRRSASFGLTVSGERATSSPSRAEDELVADLVRELRRLRRALGVDHELRDPGAVAQVDEDEPAVVAAPRGPAGERQPLADVLGPRLAAHEVAPAHGESLPRRSRRGRAASSGWPGARGASRRPAPTIDGRRRAEPPRLRQLALERAARVVGVRRDARVAQLCEPAGDALARRFRLDGEEDVDAPAASAASTPSSSSAIRSRSMPGAEADARRRRPADLLDQAVVAAAARDRRVLRSRIGPMNSNVVRV